MVTFGAKPGINKKDADHDALKKELGNLIFSVTRWCDELGYDRLHVSKSLNRLRLVTRQA